MVTWAFNKCRQRAEDSVWWPGITKDIKAMLSKCATCQINKPSQPREPMILSTMASLPWEKAATDIMEFKGQNYLVLIDYHSHYIEVQHLPDMTSKTVIAKLMSCFARHGIVKELVSDNGTHPVSTLTSNQRLTYARFAPNIM